MFAGLRKNGGCEGKKDCGSQKERWPERLGKKPPPRKNFLGGGFLRGGAGRPGKQAKNESLALPLRCSSVGCSRLAGSRRLNCFRRCRPRPSPRATSRATGTAPRTLVSGSAACSPRVGPSPLAAAGHQHAQQKSEGGHPPPVPPGEVQARAQGGDGPQQGLDRPVFPVPLVHSSLPSLPPVMPAARPAGARSGASAPGAGACRRGAGRGGRGGPHRRRGAGRTAPAPAGRPPS